MGQYWYDGDGKRVKKYVPSSGETTVFVYDAGGKLVAEYSTIVADPSTAKVAYLTNDHLGSPRINTDLDGRVISRHDYHPFGEEILTAQRTTNLSYAADTVRKQFTGYERDNEDNLDFAEARYYNSQHGRFTSVDPMAASASPSDPQSFNRYTYVRNSPLVMTDPTGMIGDYYSSSGVYLGTDDDPDDGLVYFATEIRRDDASTYIDQNSIGLTTMAEVERARAQAVPLSPGTESQALQVLGAEVSAGISDAGTGMLRGAGNLVLRSMISFAGSGPNGPTPAGIAFSATGADPIPYDNERQASYGSAVGVAAAASSVVVGGVFGGASSASIAPQSASSTRAPGPFAAGSIPARNTGPLNAAEQATVNSIGRTSGCHTCGTLNPGTKSGNFVGDHQLPSRLIAPGTPQRIYPQCLSCSRRQGGEVRTFLYGRY